jgi:type II secretory ATPase GspE/PulE/Tfp pilus assembly ATPase PilB-like protein
LKLEELGLGPELLRSLEQLLRRPNGLVLVSGPANSGKTTTLYGALERLVSPHIKIMTLEDPVEYQMEHISQAQINPSSGLTFASGLRGILRQDANVILVGEIRDKETAEISTRAALTGHLVFSTLHTRHSCGAVVRLTDMGIEPHLIVASTNGILAQRLVRRVCAACTASDDMAIKTFTRLWAHETGARPPDVDPGGFQRGRGCEACTGTGYQRRTGLFELLILTDPLKRLILDRAADSLYRAAVGEGMRSMLLDGLTKAASGSTTVEEVIRVTGETEDY